MLRAHKIRLNPTPKQEKYFYQASGLARFCFNWGLAEWQRLYKAGENPSAYKLKKQFNAVRGSQFSWSYEVSKCAIDTGFRNLDAAFKNFFHKCKNSDVKKGYPNFKSKKRSKLSFRMDGRRTKINGHWIKLEKLSEPINMTEELRFDGEIKSITISKYAGYWYVAVNVEVELPKHQHQEGTVGIDLGIKTLAVLSDGRKFENQKFLRSELKKLKCLNRKLSRQQEDSGRWNYTKSKLAKFHKRIADRRMDYHHKMTTEIARTYQIIAIEDLNVAGMLRKHHLSLCLADAGFGEIKRQLFYKAEWYGGKLVQIDRFFPSSKLCRFCNHINNNLTLTDRIWICDYCGAVLNRDENAALNIKKQALNILGWSGFTDQVKNGRGQDIRLFGAILEESSKLVEERRPSELVTYADSVDQVK